LREQVRIALERIRARRPAKSALLVGLRGVGKTVLLERMRRDAESSNIQTLRVEAPESRSLPALLAPQLRQALLRLSRNAQARDLSRRALQGLAGFVTALKVRYKDIEVGIDLDPEPGLADNGDLDQDLPALFEVVGQAADRADTALAMFIDEMQYVEEEELAALITALHRAAQLQLPVVLVGAGLPQLPGRMGRAKSYAERLFNIVSIGPLSPEDAKAALVHPARWENVEFNPDALDRIVGETEGYPYFLQEWGKHCWDAADASPITLEDVNTATRSVIAALDEGFFRIRFDRLSPAEKRYLRAMAELGPGPHRSGEIARLLNRPVKSVAPLRAILIQKGMVWSPGHGDTAFSVPRFDAFMRRIMPGEDWREGP
jgi:hypothetical protein